MATGSTSLAAVHHPPRRRLQTARSILRSALCCVLRSEDVDVLRDLRALVLRDALRDPHNVADLLLAEFDVGPEETVVELLLEGVLVELHLQLKEGVLHRLLLARARLDQHVAIVLVRVERCPHLVHVSAESQARRALGVQLADARVELELIVLAQLRLERVDGDVDRAPVRFELEDAAHDLRRLPAALGLDEVVEVLEVGLVKRVADDLDVELVKILHPRLPLAHLRLPPEREDVCEVGADGRLDKHHLVEVLGGVWDGGGGEALEHAERVALCYCFYSHYYHFFVDILSMRPSNMLSGRHCS
mmetsp:Transcript_15739/g.36406  ORF Transcript_15739/g.36406 Transcript_15739/m.36406 type:complete len:304 (+) Transcript_15739:300-1211(+)